MQLYPTVAAAKLLGLTCGILRSWRRRGIGPSYVKQPGGWVCSRGGVRVDLPGGFSFRIGHGELHWSDPKTNGTVYYRADQLRAFVEARLVPRGERFLPRPFPGRLPGGSHRTAAVCPLPVACGARRPRSMGDRWLCNAATAACLLGVLTETMRTWRRRGIGPAYVRFPGGHVRRGMAYGHISYPLEELRAFARAWLVEFGRLPYSLRG
jgi:hypothetical protein